MPQAFEGIRVIDFTQVLAGPFAVMQLALLGAEVVKIEHPQGGDQTRGSQDGKHKGMSASFLGMNLNKKSLTLNLKSPEGVEIVKRLVATADVVVENFKAGTMQRVGLNYELLKEIKPDLIFCSITGYGQKGPKAGEAAYDGAIQASSGMMSQTGYLETGPTRTGYMPVDMSTALNAAFAISAALFRRAETGLGQQIDVAMMDTAIVMQASQFSEYLNEDFLPGLLGNASPTLHPTANVFETCDSFIQVLALRQAQVEKLFDALGLGDQISMAKYSTPGARIKYSAEVSNLIGSALKLQSTEHWMRILSSIGIPVAEIRSLPDVMTDPQLEYRGVFETFPSLIEDKNENTVVKAGYITDEDGPTYRSPPPSLGKDTEEILRSVGYEESEINQFSEDGVI
ncbi:MAG: CoA transferase [Pseudomonadales bacterium]|nr:CoA transferase [Pseudomonadales bacterium]